MKSINNIFSNLAFAVLFIGGSFSAGANELTVIVLDPLKEKPSDVIVYVSPLFKGDFNTEPTQPIIMDQIDKKFAPYVTVLQKGQAINFVNKDDITHHIYSVSGDNRFAFKVKAGETHSTDSLNTAEEVAMGCNIHDWMSGYALVVDTPYFAKTDESGQVTFNLPQSGRYQISVWHPQLDVKNNKVMEVHEVANDKMTITIGLPNKLLPIPEQSGHDEFDFLEEY